MYKKFNQSIDEILSSQTSSGLFSKTVEIACESVTYRFSWSTGMYSSHISRKYQEHFGRLLPEWVNLQHPHHMVGLCQLALDTNSHLPTQFNSEYPNKRRDD